MWAVSNMRTWDNEIQLISVVKTTDADGYPVEEMTETTVLANKLPVRSSEYYAASQAGYLIEKTFEINSIEYDGQEDLRFENEVYRIVRTYEKDDFIELYCEKRKESPT
jgi:SPP1 family predicted phage head-tail adaptor